MTVLLEIEEVWAIGMAVSVIAMLIYIAPMVIASMIVLTMIAVFVPLIVGTLVLLLWKVVNNL